YYEASVDELKKYVESVEDKESLLPAILEICNIKNSEEELKKQIDEALKDPLNQINQLIELIKKNQNAELS
ncbi:7245_t:CDS:1, partial [Dentiscutata heterogama]